MDNKPGELESPRLSSNLLPDASERIKLEKASLHFKSSPPEVTTQSDEILSQMDFSIL